MNDLRSRGEAFLALSEKEISDSKNKRLPIDDLPVFIECGGNKPIANTWSEFLLLVLHRFLEGGSWNDPELKNNLALLINVLPYEIDSSSGDTKSYLQECFEVLDGIWTEIYGE